LLNISDPKAMIAGLREMCLSVLEELRRLPETVDEGWLDQLDKEVVESDRRKAKRRSAA
jgi:hypothetical protein